MKTLNAEKVSVWTDGAKISGQDFLTLGMVRLPFVKGFGCIMELKKACGYTVDPRLLFKSGDQAQGAPQGKAEPHYGLKSFSAVTHRKAHFHGGLYNGG